MLFIGLKTHIMKAKQIINWPEITQPQHFVYIKRNVAFLCQDFSEFYKQDAVLSFPSLLLAKYFVNKYDGTNMSNYKQACLKRDYDFYVYIACPAGYHADVMHMFAPELTADSPIVVMYNYLTRDDTALLSLVESIGFEEFENKDVVNLAVTCEIYKVLYSSGRLTTEHPKEIQNAASAMSYTEILLLVNKVLVKLNETILNTKKDV